MYAVSPTLTWAHPSLVLEPIARSDLYNSHMLRQVRKL
jgi:hypothetical protein